MRIDILTLFPEMLAPALGISMLGRAADAGLVSYELHNIRDWSQDKHGKVDDRPFGGEPGMVMMAQPLYDAVTAVEAQDDRPATRVLLTPQGERLRQARVEALAGAPRLLLIAGRYEGIDERAIEALEPLEISVGDYVTSGGEVPALLLVSIAALLRAYSRLFTSAPLTGANLIIAAHVFVVALALFLERSPDLTAPHPDELQD